MRICSVEGCTRKHHSHGYCRPHLKLIERNGKPERVLLENKGKVCSVDGCDSPAYKKGYCNKHFQRVKKFGTTELPQKEMKFCSVEGCEKEANGSIGLCEAHYYRFKKYGDANAPRLDKNPLKGTVCKHCGVGVVAKKDFCETCYHQHMMGTSPSYCEAWRVKILKRRVLEKTIYSEPYTRQEVYDKTNGICGICGLPVPREREGHKQLYFTVDHVIPLSRGGEDTLENVQPAHSLCNSTKNNLVLAEEKLLGLKEKVSKLLGENKNA